jgi:hypothetical protein
VTVHVIIVKRVIIVMKNVKITYYGLRKTIMKYFKIEKYKYEVAETYCCQTKIIPPQTIDQEDFGITASGIVMAKKGYMWDGPSGPTIDRKENMRGSLIHDIFAEAMRQGLLPQSCWIPANEELGRLCIEDGMNSWWAKNVYVRGVSLTNNWCRVTCKPEHEIIEILAPEDKEREQIRGC